MTKKIKSEVQIDGNKANLKSVYITEKIFDKQRIRRVLNKFKHQEKPEPNNKYKVTKNSLKNKRLLTIKIIKFENNVKLTFRQQKREIIGEPPLQVVLKTEDLEYGVIARARRRAKNHYNRRKGIYRVLFFALNLAVIFGILLYQKNTMGVLDLDQLLNSNLKLEYLGYAFLAVIAIMLLETLKTQVLIFRSTKVRKPVLCYKSSATNIYYENIIPMGGKPFEVLYLNNKGIKPSIATSVPLAKYVFATIASILMSTLVIISKWSFLQESSELILFLGIAMLVCNMFVVLMLVLFASSKKLAPRLVYGIIRILHKVKIIKNPREKFTQFMRFILEYQKSIQYYVKTRYVAVVSIISSILISIIGALIPFFIYGIFMEVSFSIMLDLVSKYYIMKIATFFFPVPGGVGVSEISFTAMFASMFTDGLLFWAVLLFRFFTYYIYLIQGVIVVGIDTILSKKNKNKLDINNNFNE